jgi:hypothetical protein
VVRTSLHYRGGGPRSSCLLQRLELKHPVEGMLRRLETLTLFLRTLLAFWRWVMALVATQGLELCLEGIVATS